MKCHHRRHCAATELFHRIVSVRWLTRWGRRRSNRGCWKQHVCQEVQGIPNSNLNLYTHKPHTQATWTFSWITSDQLQTRGQLVWKGKERTFLALFWRSWESSMLTSWGSGSSFQTPYVFILKFLWVILKCLKAKLDRIMWKVCDLRIKVPSNKELNYRDSIIPLKYGPIWCPLAFFPPKSLPNAYLLQTITTYYEYLKLWGFHFELLYQAVVPEEWRPYGLFL